METLYPPSTRLLVSLSKAIAQSARILANAAGAILKVGAVAVALYAAFKLVGGVIDKLLGKGKGGSEYLIKLIEEQNHVYLTALNEKLDDVNQKLAGIWGEFGLKIDHVNQKLGWIRGYLRQIRDNTFPLRKLKFATYTKIKFPVMAINSSNTNKEKFLVFCFYFG